MAEMNSFVKADILSAGANGAHTENGAVSYATIGSALLDQFGKAASYRGRDINLVWDEQSALWAENSEAALKFPFYLRMITRQSNILNGEKTEKVQRGAGVRDEAFKRLLWIAKYHPTEFYRNLWLLPIVGSWKDLWVLLAFDGADEYLKTEMFYKLLAEGINDANHKDLVKKFMPRIRSEKKCTTVWAKKTNALAKGFAKFAGWSFSDYRSFKSTGKAHAFQRLITQGLYGNLEWGKISGKALLNLVSGKFLSNHGLTDSYIEWLKSQPSAKFNGYAFELGRKVTSNWRFSTETQITIDKQFEGLINTAKKDNGAIKGNVLCALDTSGSMTWTALDSAGTTPYDVCLSLGVYFSELNEGAFHNVVAEFDDASRLITLNGTFTEKLKYLHSNCNGYGSTNFQSLIDLLVKTRLEAPQIPLEDYPKTLLVVSDMQFNPSMYGNNESNYEVAMSKLRRVFPSEFVDEFKIIWWFCTNRKTSDFPSTMEDKGTYMLSGYDGAIVSFILGGEGLVAKGEAKAAPSMEDVINAAFSQEILALVK